MNRIIIDEKRDNQGKTQFRYRVMGKRWRLFWRVVGTSAWHDDIDRLLEKMHKQYWDHRRQVTLVTRQQARANERRWRHARRAMLFPGRK